VVRGVDEEELSAERSPRTSASSAVRVRIAVKSTCGAGAIRIVVQAARSNIHTGSSRQRPE
jgi:hypothetical protein